MRESFESPKITKKFFRFLQEVLKLTQKITDFHWVEYFEILANIFNSQNQFYKTDYVMFHSLFTHTVQ